MVTSVKVEAHFKNLCSNKHYLHYLVQFLAKMWASTANIKGMVVLQTCLKMKAHFNTILLYFSLYITIRSLYIVTLNAHICCAHP